MKTWSRHACALGATLAVAFGLNQSVVAGAEPPEDGGESSAYGWFADLHGTAVPEGTFVAAPAPQVAGSGMANVRKVEQGKDFPPAGAIGFGSAETGPAVEPGDGGSAEEVREPGRTAQATAEQIVLFDATPAELRIGSVRAGCLGDGSAEFAVRDAVLAGEPLPANPEPNTRIFVQNPTSELPMGVLILNERIKNADGSTTVQGARYVVNIPAAVGGIGDAQRDTYAAGEIVLASTTCAPTR